MPPAPDDVVPVLVHTEASYRLGITYDDELVIGVRNDRIEEAKGKLVQSYAVFSEGHGGKIAATGIATILLCNVEQGGELKRSPCPAHWSGRYQ